MLRLRGPWITLALVAVLQATSGTALGLPNPPALLVIAVVYAGFEGGLPSGLASAVIAWGYLPFAFSDPGHLFTYSDANLRRIVVWAVTLPATAVMVGMLKRRAMHAGALEQANADLELQIGERKKAERELRETEARLREAVEAGAVGLWDWDLRTDTVHYSSEWKRQIGYEASELSDSAAEWSDRLHPEDGPRVLDAMQAFIHGTASSYEVEFRLRHRDGSYRHILSRASRLRDETGTPIRLLGSHVDITEHTQLKVQLQHAQKMDSIGRLAGGIAHDFNNLLTVINATADMGMHALPVSDPMHAELAEIRRAGERAASLTRQLLAFSRSQIVAPEIVSLNALIGEMEKMFARLLGVDIALVVRPAPDGSWVVADPGQLEQVVLNLVVNARDAMPAGGTLTIAIRQVDDPNLAPGPQMMLEVSDTGSGMDERTRAHIFEPFFTTKEQGKGTGLGLATVYGIVKQSGGTVLVDSELGRGTTFRVLLPRAEDPEGAAAPARPAGARGSETVLVVEDEVVLLRLAGRILEGAGYSVLMAGSGDEALQLLERHEAPVHLMLSDVVMPGISGPELASRVRERRPGMKVLFASGYTDDAILREGVFGHSANFLNKPYTIEALTRKVREVLDA